MRRLSHDDESETESIPEPTRAIELRIDLERAIQRLSTSEQTVLLHCVQLGLSHEEAAYVLAMPLGTVKTHATRSKAKLKKWRSDCHDVSEGQPLRRREGSACGR